MCPTLRKLEPVTRPLRLSEHKTKIALVLCTDKPVAELVELSGFSEGTVRNIKGLKTQIAREVKEWCDHYHMETFIMPPARRFTPTEIAEIRGSSSPSPKLAKKFGCSPSTIRMIKTGKTYNG